MIYSAHDIAGLGTILGVWAHPDDESWCMGGLLAQASQNGQRVVCVTASCGDAGTTSDESRWPQAKLGDIRRQELANSLEILGVNEHMWLDCQDGELASMDSSGCIKKLRQLIEEIKPDSIFTFGSDGLTGHSDHIAVYEWTRQAMREANLAASLYSVIELENHFNSSICKRANEKFAIIMNSDTLKTIPRDDASLVYDLTQSTKDKKLRALQAHACQIERFTKDPDGYEFVLSLCQSEAFMKVAL